VQTVEIADAPLTVQTVYKVLKTGDSGQIAGWVADNRGQLTIAEGIGGTEGGASFTSAQVDDLLAKDLAADPNPVLQGYFCETVENIDGCRSLWLVITNLGDVTFPEIPASEPGAIGPPPTTEIPLRVAVWVMTGDGGDPVWNYLTA